MARIAESEIERLGEEVSVLRLVEAAGIALEKRGKNHAGRCPFHEDDTASLVITSSKNLWHCFGCDAGGGPIDWVMKCRGVSFRHAVELLREGLPLAADRQPASGLSASRMDRSAFARDPVAAPPKQSRVRALPPPVALESSDQALLVQTVDYYHATLKASPEALAYLEARGLRHAELIDRFRLGYANRTLGLRLPEKTRKAGSQIRARLERLGIYRESGHEHLNGSLVVPVFDAAGKVTEVYGRKIRDDLRPGTALHLYLPGAHKGVWNETGLAASGGEVILCEALIDAMTFWVAGLRNVTASYGVNGFTPDHRAAFERHGIRRVLIAYDRDEAGNKAAAEQPPSSLAAASMPEDAEADAPAPPLQASPVPTAPPAPAPAEQQDNAVRLSFGDRHYRVRGLEKNTSPEILKLNLLVAFGERFHVDTFDLYAARARSAYIAQAAAELRLPEEVIRTDLGKLLLQLEALQDERLRKTLDPAPAAGPVLCDEDRRAALALLTAPDLIGRIGADLEAAGITGEATNKLVGYLAATSRKLANPLAVVIRSSSAAGKTSLMDAVLAMMPEEERIRYSAMTGQPLFYMGQTSLKHKILALAEEEGASRASYALKLLQSEGELTIASTGRDAATGNLVTQEYRVEGPVMLFTTTTALDIDPELLNRCLVLTIDEGRQQTQAIHRLQRQRRTLQGLLAQREKAYIVALHRNAQRLLRPLAVMNPYADCLTFPDHATRTRRDHEKYLSLIETIALLHQYQRPSFVLRTSKGEPVEYIEVTKDDIAHANDLAHEVLGRSLDELPPQTRSLLRLLGTMVEGMAGDQAVARAQVRFIRREAREALGLGDTQLRLHLDRLVEFEYVLAHRSGPDGRFVYELAYDGRGEEGRPHLPGLIDIESLNVAHIFVSFLAYCLYITLHRRLRALAPGLTARSALEKFAAVQMIDICLPTSDGRELQLTRYTQPEPELQLLLKQMKLVLPPQPPPNPSSPIGSTRSHRIRQIGAVGGPVWHYFCVGWREGWRAGVRRWFAGRRLGWRRG